MERRVGRANHPSRDKAAVLDLPPCEVACLLVDS